MFVMIAFVMFLAVVAGIAGHKTHRTAAAIQKAFTDQMQSMAESHATTLKDFIAQHQALTATMKSETAVAFQALAGQHTKLLDGINTSHTKAADRLEVVTAAMAEAAADIRGAAKQIRPTMDALHTVADDVSILRHYTAGPREANKHRVG